MAYQQSTRPLIDNLFHLGQSVTALCKQQVLKGCRNALKTLFDTSMAYHDKFATQPYPPCMLGYHTVIMSITVGYHNASIAGLGALDSHNTYTVAPAMKSIEVEENTITQTSLLDIPFDCTAAF